MNTRQQNRFFKRFATALGVAITVVTLGCAQSGSAPEVAESIGQPADVTRASTNSTALAAALEAQTAEHKARYSARHPADTLSFFGIEPGMSVAEALPGGGWYSKILAAYLGSDGTLYGVNYQDSVWSSFGFPEDRVKQQVAATAAFPQKVAEWSDSGITAEGFTFADVPENAVGSVDAVLFFRALHNLNRFKETGVLDEAIAAAHFMLKPGGVVGVVQHRAPENAPDDWATGRAGYLKPSSVIEMFTRAGFTFEASSEINANPEDKPTPDDVVWRLPPSYAKGEDTKAAMDAIGESDRMTMRFRKAG